MEEGDEQPYGPEWFLDCGFSGTRLAWGFLAQMDQSFPPSFTYGWWGQSRELQGRTCTPRYPSLMHAPRSRAGSWASLCLGQTWPGNMNCVAGPKPAPTEGSVRRLQKLAATRHLADEACWFFFSSFPFMLPSMQAQVVDTELLLSIIKDQIIFFCSPFD